MIITLANQKGGVSKTTTAAAIGQGLAHKGCKVLFIDLDPQGNLTYHLGANTETSPVIADVISGNTTIKAAIQTTIGKWQVIASDHQTSLYSHDVPPERLKSRLESIKKRYDYIIIDTPPTLSALTINAITAADHVIIPTIASTYATQGIIQLNQLIKHARTINPTLKLNGILLTRYNDRSIISKQLKKTIEALAINIGSKVYKTVIRQAIAAEEAQATRKPLYEYAPKATVTKDYAALIKELERSLKQ